MAAPRTRPGNPDRGWNDPPMFNYDVGQTGSAPPKRTLNKRVAFPVSGSTGGPTPGHAVLNPSQGPPILNPVLPADIQGPPPLPAQPPVPIGLRDTPLGNQAAPQSAVQLLPPVADTSTPQTVPVLVPLLVPSSPPKAEDRVSETVQLEEERLDELMSRLALDSDSQLLEKNGDNFESVLNNYSSILTQKVCDEIRRKMEVFDEKWRKGTLSDTVKVRVTQLSTALVNGETEKANHLHLALMVDHIAEVSQWMMGVKRLLQQQQLANKEKEIISENKSLSDANITPCDQNSDEEINAEKNTEDVTVSENCLEENVTSDIAEELSGEATPNDTTRESTEPTSCDKIESEKVEEIDEDADVS